MAKKKKKRVKKAKPFIDERIYPWRTRRGRYARLLVFATQREMYQHARSRGGTIERNTRAICMEYAIDVKKSKPQHTIDMLFSAGFFGKPNEQVSHECLHAVIRFCSNKQLIKAMKTVEDEERYLAYPLGRMVRRVFNAIHDTKDSLALYAPVGRKLQEMRTLAYGRSSR